MDQRLMRGLSRLFEMHELLLHILLPKKLKSHRTGDSCSVEFVKGCCGEMKQRSDRLHPVQPMLLKGISKCANAASFLANPKAIFLI